MFESKNFNNTLKDPSRYQEYFFAFKCWEVLSAIEKGFSRDRNNRHGIANFGNGLVYGKYAIISACKSRFEGDLSLDVVGKIVDDILGHWKKFEAQVITIKANQNYFRKYMDDDGIERMDLNFNNYYKGKTVNQDIKKFFQK